MRATLLAFLILAIAPAGALAGGWATVGLSSTPEGTPPGDPWEVEMTILQHGRSETPLSGLKPTLTVVGEGGERRTFATSPTKRPGVYRARVVFPSAGIWRYEVNDNFPDVTHSYPPVQIGAGSAGSAAAPPEPDGGPNAGLALLVAAMAGVGAGLAVRRFRRPHGTARAAEA